ncbi:MAG: NAD(P)H-dependent glycerol-3-phosphate dehydrogenase [Clostridia bacterium]
MKVSVLGCGRWGSFLAWYSDKIGCDTSLWGRTESKNFAQLVATRANEYVTFGDGITFDGDLTRAISRADVIIISISSQQLRGFLGSIDKTLWQGKKIVLCMKGIEEGSGKRLTQVAIEQGVDQDQVAVWLGPGHIQEFVKGVPNCMTIDSYNHALTRELVDIFNSNLIRFYYGFDIIGNEIGGATKNIVGIAAGMLDGFGYSSLKGPLMSRGVREVARLIKAVGGREETAYGLTHLGDYETTLFSEHSNNRRYGENFVKGIPSLKLAEGVMTTKAVVELAAKYDVDMPITQAVYDILFENVTPQDALTRLFARDIKREF